nr:hypothetical protein [Lacrimispora aerotolerans]
MVSNVSAADNAREFVLLTVFTRRQEEKEKLMKLNVWIVVPAR